MTSSIENGIDITSSYGMFDLEIDSNGTLEINLEKGNIGQDQYYTYTINSDQTTLTLNGVSFQEYDVSTGLDVGALQVNSSYQSTWVISNLSNSSFTITMTSTTIPGVISETITFTKGNGSNIGNFDLDGDWTLTNETTNGINTTANYIEFVLEIDATNSTTGEAYVFYLENNNSNIAYVTQYNYTINSDQTIINLTGVITYTYDLLNEVVVTGPLSYIHSSSYAISNLSNNTITLTMTSTTTPGLSSYVLSFTK